MITDNERLEADEYEKQYYGFSSTQFYVDFCFQYEKTLQATISAAEKALMDEKFSTQYDTSMLSLRTQKLHSSFMEVAQEPMVKLKEECRKIFAIPKNVLLEEDQCKLKDYTEKDILQLKLDIAKLEEDLIKEQILLSKREHLKQVIEGSIMPIYDKVNDILLATCDEVSQNKKTCDEDKKKLEKDVLLDEIQCITNFKFKGYRLSKGFQKTLKIDLNH